MNVFLKVSLLTEMFFSSDGRNVWMGISVELVIDDTYVSEPVSKLNRLF